MKTVEVVELKRKRAKPQRDIRELDQREEEERSKVR